MIRDLKRLAVKEFNWYLHNVCTNTMQALVYAQKTYDHAYECGYITEIEFKKLCLDLPFDTYIK